MTKQELAAKIWATANALRKNIKASDYKDYILGFMFYKYICDNQLYTIEEFGGDIEILKESSDDVSSATTDVIGYFIAYDDLFSTWQDKGIHLSADDVSQAIERFYKSIGENNTSYKFFNKIFSALSSGLKDLGENAGSRDKAVQDIVHLISDIPPKSKDYDVLGYIYEYLIKKFSSEAKKDGAFYTPHGLTSLMAKIVAERLKNHKNDVTVYDPTVGTAGLLLNIGKELGKYIHINDIHYYGQELITETFNLAKMNLFMQDIPVDNIHVRNGDTLRDDWPYFDEDTAYETLPVDAVVSNPPYSQGWEPDNYKLDDRFKYGLAPKTKADLAFLLHCLYHVKEKDGIMAIVLPHGVLFRGGAEYEIRKNLVENHNIETIIGFPANMFFSTGIPVIVMILSKGRKSDDILFIDASQSFMKESTQNVLQEKDIEKIFNVVMHRKSEKNFAKLVEIDDIRANDYNLNIPRYISATLEKIPLDPYSVMSGLVSETALTWYEEYFESFPSLKNELYTSESGYCTLKTDSIEECIFANKDVQQFITKTNMLTIEARQFLTEQLLGETIPNDILSRIKSMIFEKFRYVKLLDVYSVYQAFFDEWDTIEADTNRIRNEGRGICREIEPDMVLEKSKSTGMPEEVQKGIKGKIISVALVQKVYFAEELKELASMLAEISTLESDIEQMWSELEDDVKSTLSKEDDAENSKPESRKLKARVDEILSVITSPKIDTLLRYLEIKGKAKKLTFIQEHPEIAWDDMKANKDGSFGAATVKSYIHALRLHIQPDIETSDGKIVAILQKSNEISALSKNAELFESELEDKAIEKMSVLTEDEINELLTKKWIDPITDSISGSITRVVSGFAENLQSLHDLYANPIPELDTDISETEQALGKMLDMLCGNEKDMEAISIFRKGLF